MAEKIIAMCGLICSDCGAYIATQKNDNKLRQAQAEIWSKQYNHPFKAGDINCDGCTSTGRLIGYCAVCPIRKCATDKKIANCGWCVDYPCKNLEPIFKARPVTKKTLDAIKKGKK